MEENKPKKQEYVIPDNVLKMTEGTIKYPSVIETDFYVKDALDSIINNNILLWSVKYFNGNSIQFTEGLIKFKQSNSYLYFTKRVDENSYKFFAIINEETTDSMIFYLNTIKKHKTI